MNVSISDAYNLTWKLALVMKGLANANLLDTYESERKLIATQLINVDAKFAKAFMQRTNLDDIHCTIFGKRMLVSRVAVVIAIHKALLVSDQMRQIGRAHV